MVGNTYRLREALDNLIDNALRFAPSGMSIEVRAKGRHDALTVEVLDRGPGFPEEFLPHAFERFRRPTADRSRSDGGAGLGVAIVDVIARAHGGAASVRNREGGGAAVVLEIPVARPPAASGTPSNRESSGVRRISDSSLTATTPSPKTPMLREP